MKTRQAPDVHRTHCFRRGRADPISVHACDGHDAAETIPCRIRRSCFPQSAYFGNFVEAWNANHFSRYFLNSLLVAAAATVIIMLYPPPGHMRSRAFPSRAEFVFYLYLFTMMVPTVIEPDPAVPFDEGTEAGGQLSRPPLIYIGIGVPSNTFFLLQFLQPPTEMEEAVIVDGGNYWQIYWRIVLPLSSPRSERSPFSRIPTCGTSFSSPHNDQTPDNARFPSHLNLSGAESE